LANATVDPSPPYASTPARKFSAQRWQAVPLASVPIGRETAHAIAELHTLVRGKIFFKNEIWFVSNSSTADDLFLNTTCLIDGFVFDIQHRVDAMLAAKRPETVNQKRRSSAWPTTFWANEWRPRQRRRMARLVDAPDQPSTGEMSPFNEFLFPVDGRNGRVSGVRER
jgi:hypothetical protein